jgi:hypothetical protein
MFISYNNFFEQNIVTIIILKQINLFIIIFVKFYNTIILSFKQEGK